MMTKIGIISNERLAFIIRKIFLTVYEDIRLHMYALKIEELCFQVMTEIRINFNERHACFFKKIFLTVYEDIRLDMYTFKIEKLCLFFTFYCKLRICIIIARGRP